MVSNSALLYYFFFVYYKKCRRVSSGIERKLRTNIKIGFATASRKSDEQMKAEGQKALEIERLNLKAAVMIWYHNLHGKQISTGHNGYSCCVVC